MSNVPEVVAVDMGGTLLRVGVVSADRTIAQQWVHRIEGRRGAAPIGALLQSALREASGWMSAHARYPAGVGIGVPGVVELEDGLVRYSANLDLHNVPLAALAREVIPAPVAVENDVRAAAWGEYQWGAGKGARYMVYLSAGTGIAAAVIDDGRPYRGSRGQRASWATPLSSPMENAAAAEMSAAWRLWHPGGGSFTVRHSRGW